MGGEPERARRECIAIPVIHDIEHDPVRQGAVRVGLEPDLDARRDPDVEDLAVSCEPRIGPATVVADANRRSCTNDSPRTGSVLHDPIMPGRLGARRGDPRLGREECDGSLRSAAKIRKDRESQIGEIPLGAGSPEEIALGGLNAEFAESGEVTGTLNSFGDDGCPEVADSKTKAPTATCRA